MSTIAQFSKAIHSLKITTNEMAITSLFAVYQANESKEPKHLAYDLSSHAKTLNIELSRTTAHSLIAILKGFSSRNALAACFVAKNQKLAAKDFNKDNLPQEIFDEIFEALYAENSGKKINAELRIIAQYQVFGPWIDTVNQSDVINCSASGSIEIDNERFEFYIKDGNWNGSELIDFDRTISMPKKTVRVSVPVPYTREELSMRRCSIVSNESYQMYLTKFEYRKPELEEMARSRSYDSFFSPTNQIQKHYDQKATDIGFKWETQEIECD